MDEATSALDKNSEENILRLIHQELPSTTILSVGHRPELELYHERKIALEHRPGGARIVSDEALALQPGRFGLLRRMLRRQRREEPPLSVPERHPGDRLARPVK